MAFRYERTRTLVSHVKKKVSQKTLIIFCRKLVKMYIVSYCIAQMHAPSSDQWQNLNWNGRCSKYQILRYIIYAISSLTYLHFTFACKKKSKPENIGYFLP